MICTPHPILFGWSNWNEVGGACSTYGGEQRCIRGFGRETWGKQTTWKTQV